MSAPKYSLFVVLLLTINSENILCKETVNGQNVISNSNKNRMTQLNLDHDLENICEINHKSTQISSASVRKERSAAVPIRTTDNRSGYVYKLK